VPNSKFKKNIILNLKIEILSYLFTASVMKKKDLYKFDTQDFTDSAYTSHERRQHIIVLCERAKMDLIHLLRTMGGSSGVKDKKLPHFKVS
jgi:hypothetical protein